MKKQTLLVTTLLSSFIATSSTHAGWQDMLKGLMQEQAPATAPQTQSAPTAPSLSLNDPEAIATFILNYFGLKTSNIFTLHETKSA